VAEQWQINGKTIPTRAMQLELLSRNSNDKTDDEIEETVKLLTGQLLRQMSYCTSLRQLLDTEQQFNLGTPVMEVHLSSALLAMVSLSMSTSDLLKTLLYTWRTSAWIMKNEDELLNFQLAVKATIDELMEDYRGF